MSKKLIALRLMILYISLTATTVVNAYCYNGRFQIFHAIPLTFCRVTE